MVKCLLLLIRRVNVVFTHQYDGLEALYKKYKDQGLEIIAVPSNQFGEENLVLITKFKNFVN